MDTYSTENLKRCLKWGKSSEGHIFWAWLKEELGRVTEGSEKFIGAWEQDKIIKANKMLARQEEAEYISEFLERLAIVINEKESGGQELTTLEEL